MILFFGLPLWVLIVEIVLAIIWIFFVQLECYGWSTALMIISLASLHFLARIPIFSYIKEEPFRFILWVGLYFVLAISWSLIKWVFFLYKFKSERENKLQELRKDQDDEFDRVSDRNSKGLKKYEKALAYWENNQIGIKPALFEVKSFEQKSDYELLKGYKFGIYNHNTELNSKPMFRDYKGTIVAWAVFWVPSVIGTIFDDFVRMLIRRIVNSLNKIYQMMSDKIVGEVPNKAK